MDAVIFQKNFMFTVENRMKKLVFALFLIANSVFAAPVEVDRIVAVVGGDVITHIELQARLQTAKKQLKRQNTPLPPDSELVPQILERLIMDKVQIQRAKEVGLEISDSMLDVGLKRLAENNKMMPEKFQAEIQKEGVDWNVFKEEIRDEMLIARLRETEVDSRIQISDAEIDNYLKLRENQNKTQLALSHIVIRLPENPTAQDLERIEERANNVRQRLLNGENFSQMAAAFSDSQDALQGGKMGLRPVSQLPELYVNAAANLEVGGISAVLRSPGGFHIIQLLERQGKKTAEEFHVIEQTHARHILLRITEIVSESQARQTLEEVLRQISVGESFETLAKRYSQDASAANGGDLGWVNPGDTVPQFENAMNALKPGEVSGIIKTPFGLHLIQVIERRSKDVSDERERGLARRDLHLRRLEEVYQDWLRQLRDNTYVEIRLNDDNF